DVKAQLKSTEDSLKAVGEQAMKTGSILTASITAPILALGKAAVDSATRMDSLKRALTAVSGSSKDAEEQLVRLKEVAKLPGLGFEEAVKGSLRLQNAGLKAREAERMLSAFGNAIARAGGGKAELDGVTLALGQIATKGKISQEEINQLVERGINLGPILKKAFGSADTEKLQKAGITTKQFFDAILPELEKLPKVTGGAQNAFENMADAAQQSLAKIGEAILPVLLPIVEKITLAIQVLADRFKALSPDVQQGIVVFAGLAAILGPVLVAVGAVASAIAAVGIPVAAAIAAIGLLGAAFATNIGGIRDATMSVLKPALDFFQEQFEKVKSWIDQNMPLIQRTVQTVLQTISELWEEHGQQILSVVGPVWDAVKTIISTALDAVLGILRTAMLVINGDWSGAWNGLLTTVDQFGLGLMRLLGDIVKGIYNALVLMVETTMDLNGRFLAAGLGIGSSLGKGIVQGLKSAWNDMVDSVKGFFGLAQSGGGDEDFGGGDFGETRGGGGSAAIDAPFGRTRRGRVTIPNPVGPKPLNVDDLIGGKKKKGKTDAERAAERAAADAQSGREGDAGNAVAALTRKYEALLDLYKEQGGIQNLKKLREMAEHIKLLQQGAAFIKYQGDKKDNPKGALSTFRGDNADSTEAFRQRTKTLDAAKAERIKLAASRDEKAASERADALGRELEAAADLQLKADKEAADEKFRQTEILIKADENIRAATAEINRQIQRDTLSRFDFERAELDRTVEKYRQTGVDEVTIETLKQAELARIRGEELREMQSKADAAAKSRVKAESAAARQMRQIFRGVGDDIGRVAEESIERWKGFGNFFESLAESIKSTMAKLAANIVTSWAKVQLVGGAKAGFAGSDGIGGILGSLFGGRGQGAGPGGVGTPPFIEQGAKGSGGMGAGGLAAMAGGKGGLMGLLGKGGLFGGSILQNLGWAGAGFAVNKLLGNPVGKLFGGIKKLFRFNQGGILPTGVPSIINDDKNGNYGEAVVPRTPSMAIPQHVMNQLRGGGGGTFGTVTVSTPSLRSAVIRSPSIESVNSNTRRNVPCPRSI
ncbi:MAG: tape measure protein, partial [Armatimonadota bacterium]